MSQVAIRAALETAVNGMAALSTAWENNTFSPPDSGTPYQKVNLLFAQPDNPTMGDSFHRERGILQISLFYPIQKGPSAAAARAELIRSTFARGNSFTSGGVTVTIERTPEIGPGLIDGDRWAVITRTRFYSNIF